MNPSLIVAVIIFALLIVAVVGIAVASSSSDEPQPSNEQPSNEQPSQQPTPPNTPPEAVPTMEDIVDVNQKKRQVVQYKAGSGLNMTEFRDAIVDGPNYLFNKLMPTPNANLRADCAQLCIDTPGCQLGLLNTNTNVCVGIGFDRPDTTSGIHLGDGQFKIFEKSFIPPYDKVTTQSLTGDNMVQQCWDICVNDATCDLAAFNNEDSTCTTGQFGENKEFVVMYGEPAL